MKLIKIDGSLIEMNPAGLRLVEADSFSEVEGVSVYPLITEEYREAFIDLHERVFDGESGMLEFRLKGLKGNYRWLETHASPFHDESGKVVAALGITRDVTERKKTAALIAEQNEILSRIALGRPLSETLESLLLSIEGQSPEMFCSILIADADGNYLKDGVAPRIPSEYMMSVDGIRIAEGEGSCGTAAFIHEPVHVEDIATDPLWEDYREAALKHGLKACWSVPIYDTQCRITVHLRFIIRIVLMHLMNTAGSSKRQPRQPLSRSPETDIKQRFKKARKEKLPLWMALPTLWSLLMERV